MDNSRVMEIVAIQEKAMTDEEYLHLHVDYSYAQEKFCRFMREMSPWETEIVENYLLTAAALHQRLMELAIDYGRKTGEHSLSQQ